MFHIYGKRKDDDRYKVVNTTFYGATRDEPWFPGRRIHATLIATWEEAERICYDLEEEFKLYVFESRKT